MPTTKKVLAAHLADQHAFHKAACADHEANGEQESNGFAMHKTAMDACANKMEMCSKSEEDELGKNFTSPKDLQAVVDAAVASAMLKALGVLGDRIRPDGIRGVIPDRPGIRIVPRAGQQESIAKAAVPVEFSKLVDDDQGPDSE
jgi:hypothetical protein